jgi:hypothetical protein
VCYFIPSEYLFLFPIVVERIVTLNGNIRRPGAIMPVTVVLTFLGLITGVLDAVVRFALSTLYTLLTIGVVHQSVLPPSMLWLDTVYGGYLANLRFNHVHRNPILEQAVLNFNMEKKAP